MPPKLFTIPETADLLGVSGATVYRLIAVGDLESCDVSPTGSKQAKTRVSEDAIEKFIKARTRTSKRRR